MNLLLVLMVLAIWFPGCSQCRLERVARRRAPSHTSTHLPLRLWFRAIYHLTQTKQGISSIELGRRLGVTPTTAWKIKHKLKQVMLERDATKRLTGRVSRSTMPISAANAQAESEAEGRLARRRSSQLSRRPPRESQFA